jgi:DNA-binding XRE family transcriptional regulator
MSTHFQLNLVHCKDSKESRIQTIHDPVAVVFGRNVRTVRKDHHLTQAAFAKKAGLERTYISDVERGSRNITLASMVRIARALGTTTANLCRQIN